MSDLILSPLEWSTEKRKVSDLIPYEYNPRKLSDEKKEKLKASLERFNLAEIPAINTDNMIIAGHQRVVVLLEIGRGDELIDVRVPSRTLTEEEFKIYNISSNVPTGEWDVDILNAIFADIDLLELGLDVSAIPLPESDISLDLFNEEEDEFEVKIPVSPISVTGDVYEFRSSQKKLTHKLICGDSTDITAYDKLLQEEQIRLFVTDPPYNVDYEGGTKDKLKIQNDKMKTDEFYDFLLGFYTAAFSKASPGCPIYVFHADTEGINFRKALKDSGFKLSQCLIWLKNSIVMGRQDYHWKHEPCLYGWKEGEAHPWYSDRKQTTILEFDRPTKSEDHPTMKPVPLFVYIIKNSSKQRDLVGDAFTGSGTTIIACEQTWRQARCLELEPGFVDVNVKRWVKYMRDNHLEYEVYRNGQILSKIEIDKYLE